MSIQLFMLYYKMRVRGLDSHLLADIEQQKARMFLTLCGLTAEAIVLCGRRLSRLTHKKSTLVSYALVYLISS